MCDRMVEVTRLVMRSSANSTEKNMVLIPFTIDPWAQFGPMLQAFFTPPHHPPPKRSLVTPILHPHQASILYNSSDLTYLPLNNKKCFTKNTILRRTR